MDKQNIEFSKKRVEKKHKKRTDKKMKKMKVDGASVKNLERVIRCKVKDK